MSIRNVTCTRCGLYNIGTNIADDIVSPSHNAYERRYILSGLARNASDASNPITITGDNVGALLQSVAIPTNPLKNMDLALLYVSEHQAKADHELQVSYENDCSVAFARDGDEFRYLLDALVDRRFLDRRGDSQGRSNQFYRVTPEGWEKVEELKRTQVDSNQAFVAMWFSDNLSAAWEQGFEPALRGTRFDPLRVDLAEYNGKIDDYIIAQIRRSGLLVADFTGHRGGVYFEAGFAMWLGIPIIWTCRDIDIDNLHFDTRQYNHISWSSPEDLRVKLKNRIEATIPGMARTP